MAFKPSASKKHRSAEEAKLQLTSVMDMMTIILLFLISSFSTGQVIPPSKDVKLPTSKQREKPQKETTVVIGKQYILMGTQPIIETEKVANQADIVIVPLYESLQTEADKQKDLEIKYGKPWTHEILIQGDEKIQFNILLKVLATCGQTDFGKMRLMTTIDPNAW